MSARYPWCAEIDGDNRLLRVAYIFMITRAGHDLLDRRIFGRL